MPDEAVVAAPSAAEVNAPVEIPRSGTPEYTEWRKSGTIPEAKTVEPPATDTPKAETAVDPDPAPGTKQESRRKPDAEARIAELTAKTRQLEKDLEDARKPKEAKADPPPARQPEVNAKPKPEDKNADGTPKYKEYEDYIDALADWKVDQKIASKEREQAQQQFKESINKKLDEARTRYSDWDEKAFPMVAEITKDGFPQSVRDIIDDSPVLADLLYTIGGDDNTKADFLRMARENPSKALRVALLMEQEIVKELGNGKESTDRNDKGQFTKPEVETPVKRGPESAPNPPIEIGNRGGIPKESDAAEVGDFAAFRRQRNAEDLRRQKGA